jgi:hypothetical protein
MPLNFCILSGILFVAMMCSWHPHHSAILGRSDGFFHHSAFDDDDPDTTFFGCESRSMVGTQNTEQPGQPQGPLMIQ